MANITAWGKANIMCFLLEEHSSLARKRKRNQIESNQRDLPRGPRAKNPPCKAGVKVPSLAGNRDPTRCRAAKLLSQLESVGHSESPTCSH